MDPTLSCPGAGTSGGWKNCTDSKFVLQGMVTRFNSRSFETDQKSD